MSKPTQLRHNSPAGVNPIAEGDTVTNPYLMGIRRKVGLTYTRFNSCASGEGGRLADIAVELEVSLRRRAAQMENVNTDAFETFWQCFPKKVAKGYARKIFARLSAEQQFAAIQALPIHVRYWKISGRAWDYLPHASTWLAGECWEDELQMPEATNGNDWMKTQSGIAAKANEVGITPRMGEDWHSLKARILGAMKAA